MTETADTRKAGKEFDVPRHSTEWRLQFESLVTDFQSRCPVAWSDTYSGYWLAASNQAVFDLARSADKLSNEMDPAQGLLGINIPSLPVEGASAGFLEMDPPRQRHYRQALNPYLSPAAVARWRPFVDEITRAALDEKIESGGIDFVDDLANIVPAVLTLAMMGLPLADWSIYERPAHASIYTPPDSPDFGPVGEMYVDMIRRLYEAVVEARSNPKPGLIDALVNCTVDGYRPDDQELAGVLTLLIGGGFDTTTALTAHALEWLSEHPAERSRLARELDTLLDPATEEFLRFYTPAQGDGRTITQDCTVAGTELRKGERLWLSWAMANRDPQVFDDPNSIVLDRKNNRHSSFGLGIHRCIGSNMARMTFKSMLTAVLERMPDFVVDVSKSVHYDTVGVINGMQHVQATFTPGPRLGAGLDETLAKLQHICDEQRLADPITERHEDAVIGS